MLSGYRRLQVIRIEMFRLSLLALYKVVIRCTFLVIEEMCQVTVE